jgi:catechol 2,3-dioxygenase-like lactoylglutathione lyase family enzyme
LPSWDNRRVIRIERSNTIVYTERWPETAGFYRDGLGLAVVSERDWFVEFALHDGSYLSVADAARSTIRPGDGAGLTLSWRVADLDETRASLADRGVVVGSIVSRWGAAAFDVVDPAGNRIEFWSQSAPAP